MLGAIIGDIVGGIAEVIWGIPEWFETIQKKQHNAASRRRRIC